MLSFTNLYSTECVNCQVNSVKEVAKPACLRHSARDVDTLKIGPRYLMYAEVARAERFGRDGVRSFFTDESGTIRYTAEDPSPTIFDPTLRERGAPGRLVCGASVTEAWRAEE